MEILVLVLIGLAVVCLLLFPRPRRTFDAYRRAHPDLCAGGKVRCFRCGGSSIWMKRIAKAPFVALYSHTCRTCGSELYESTGQ